MNKVSAETITCFQTIVTDAIKSEGVEGVIRDIETFCDDPIYLVGGFLYRSICTMLYGTGKSAVADLDFMVGDFHKERIPSAYQVRMNSYGSPKLWKDGLSIDVWRFREHVNFAFCGKEPSIENYLVLVPITVQSILYDVRTQCLQGEVGMQSILAKTIGVNNRKTYDHYHAVRKASGSISNEYDKLSLLAKELGFRIVEKVKSS